MVKKNSIKTIKREVKIPSMQLKTEKEIAMDFAVKVYKKFDRAIKSIVLFGSAAKQEGESGSDIDIVIILDDVSIGWDMETVAWYREELAKILQLNPYVKPIHVNTIKLSTWWEDLLRTDPVVVNVLRYGISLVDFGGFFEPMKVLLANGKLRPSPEAIYNCLQRAPTSLARSKSSVRGAIEGCFWCMVDSAHSALIAVGSLPPSPEHIPLELKTKFVDTKMLDKKYVIWYRDLLVLHKRISHNEIFGLKGAEVDVWQQRSEEFLGVMATLVNSLVSNK
ncbi:Nucleotidyltransferase domain protein [uncultured archaeon]|nr:Nucleotidyltransferase domain protein [uncultured archaeon]